MSGSKIKFRAEISPWAYENVAYIRNVLEGSIDIVIKEFRLGNGQKAASFYINGLINNDMMGRDFFEPLFQADKEKIYTADDIVKNVLKAGNISVQDNMSTLIDNVLQGLTALFLDGSTTAVMMEAISWPQRSVNEPSTDVVIRGPREGFIENMRNNVTLLRRKIHHPDFHVETVRLGRYTRTDIALVYVSSIVNKDVLVKLRKRLQSIDIDAVLDSGYIEQFIQDTPYSIFPTIGIAEKPDIAAAKVLDGRIAILVDGSPIALTVPMLFVEGMQSPEDYYTRFSYASWIRLIRAIALFMSIFLPGLFVAVCCFHQQIIPFRLFLSIAASESGTPFSVGFSLLIIGLAYEILREAGVRLPKPAGQAISIVGAIVMGDAAVSAGLISASVLIVLAITVVASFVTVSFVDAATLLRLIFLFLGWFFGFFGIMVGALFLLVYLCSLETFGVAYFSPFAPVDLSGLKDSILRLPLWKLRFRPRSLSLNHRRMARHDKGGDQ